jgi:hypothetical protein
MLRREATDYPAQLAMVRFQDERRHQRFNLQFPVRLTFSSRHRIRELAAMSKNVSTCSVLLEASEPVPVSTLVSLTMTVRSIGACRSIQLLGQGEVVRVEPTENASGFAVAIACGLPMTELENDLPAAV